MSVMLFRGVSICGVLLCAAGTVQAQWNEVTQAEMRRMHWQPATAQHLSRSHSSITNLPGFSVVTGVEAQRFREIIDGNGDKQIEADAFDPDSGAELVFTYIDTGHVRSDDWEDIDPDAFLAQLQANDDQRNQIRIRQGVPTIRTTGWLQKPTINNDTHTVSWIIEGKSGDGSRVANSVALKLGRTGVERIVWITDPKLLHLSNQNDLQTAINAHQYEPGYRYTDFKPATDRSAEYGIAGLVAGALGIKLLKVAGIGALLLGLKKGAFLLLLPVVWLWRKIRGSMTVKSGT